MITISIESTDRSNDIERASVSFSQSLKNRETSIKFRMKKKPGRTIPSLGDEVLLTEDGENIFRGKVTERSEWIVEGILVGFEFSCQDNTFEFDRLLVAKAYNDTDSHEVAALLIGNYTTGFTQDLQGDPVEIETIRFNYEQPSRCLDILCKNIGFEWYIDPDNVVHFFPKGTETAPFNITETNDKAYYKSIDFDRNIVELKNAVYVRGGFYLDEILQADAVDKYEADGEQRAFPLMYRYKQIQVKVDNVTQAVGIDFIDDEGDFDVLYNYQQKSIRFREDNKPTAGQLVEIYGNAEVPLIVRIQDNDSITAYGLIEAVEIDSTINSVAQAELVANELLDNWTDGSYEGSFVTHETGLRAGQAITITLPSRDIDDTFRINRITGKLVGDRMEYTVSFLKSGNISFTDIMVDLIARERRNLTISDDDVVLRFLELTQDGFELTDEIVEILTDSGPYTWASGSNEGKWGFFTWS